jgi:two-component system C4-dicarboxylate transport response regulator DctD
LEQTGRKKFDLNAADRKRLLEYEWPGNNRELRSYAFSAVLNLPRQIPAVKSDATTRTLALRVGEYERMVIAEALDATRGNVVRACALLGISRKTLYEKLARYDLDPARFRASADHRGRSAGKSRV